MIVQIKTLIFVLLFAAPGILLPLVSGRAHPVTNPKRAHHQTVFDFDSDEAEEMMTELRHEVTDPGANGAGMNSLNEVLNNVRVVAEDLAEEGAKKCHALRVPIDYEALKVDWTNCITTMATTIAAKFGQTMMTLAMRQSEFDAIKESLLRERPLSTQQKQLVTTVVFQPFCTTLIPAMSECDDPKYVTLTKSHDCKPEFEKDAEELSKMVVKDLCTNDGAWIFDFFESEPATCAHEVMIARSSPEHQARLQYMRGFEMDKTRPGRSRRLESQEEFCNLTETAGVALADLLITPCLEKNPKPGEIILHTFQNSRNFWNAKCGACSMVASTAWWSLALWCVLLKVVPNWLQNAAMQIN